MSLMMVHTANQDQLEVNHLSVEFLAYPQLQLEQRGGGSIRDLSLGCSIRKQGTF